MMRNLFILLLAGVSFASAQTVESGYRDIPEITAPGNPSANYARWYAKDDASTTKLCYKDSAGTETCIGSSGVYKSTITSATSHSVLATTHNLGTEPVVAACLDNAATPAWTMPESWTRNGSGDITLTFSPAFTGTCTLVSGVGEANADTQNVVIQVFAPTIDTATGDGAQYFPVPSGLNGYTLSDIEGHVVSTGTTGTLNVDLALCAVVATGNTCSGTVADMLSTNLTIDSGESKTSTAATAAVIDAANDDVATDEVIRIDVDAVHTTAAKGLTLVLEFTAP